MLMELQSAVYPPPLRPRTSAQSRIRHSIVRAVQSEATDRRCDQMVLQTHDFQAPEFYLRLGFEIVARVDYPHGHQSITMVKRLAAQAPE
jgi:hypothetical protein